MAGNQQGRTNYNNNKVIIMRYLIGLILCLSWLVANADDVFSMRMNAFRLVSDVLLYHNPRYSNQDPALREEYRQLVVTLSSWSAANRFGPLASSQALVSDLETAVTDVDQLAPELDYLFPVYMNKMLQTHAALDEFLASLEPQDSDRSILNDVAVSVSMQNLAYQAQVFGSLNFYLLGGDPDALSLLDDQILQRCIKAVESKDYQNLEEQQKIQDILTKYRFIRTHVTGEKQQWIPDLVARYRNSIVDVAD